MVVQDTSSQTPVDFIETQLEAVSAPGVLAKLMYEDVQGAGHAKLPSTALSFMPIQKEFEPPVMLCLT